MFAIYIHNVSISKFSLISNMFALDTNSGIVLWHMFSNLCEISHFFNNYWWNLILTKIQEIIWFWERKYSTHRKQARDLEIKLLALRVNGFKLNCT